MSLQMMDDSKCIDIGGERLLDELSDDCIHILILLRRLNLTTFSFSCFHSLLAGWKPEIGGHLRFKTTQTSLNLKGFPKFSIVDDPEQVESFSSQFSFNFC